MTRVHVIIAGSVLALALALPSNVQAQRPSESGANPGSNAGSGASASHPSAPASSTASGGSAPGRGSSSSPAMGSPMGAMSGGNDYSYAIRRGSGERNPMATGGGTFGARPNDMTVYEQRRGAAVPRGSSGDGGSTRAAGGTVPPYSRPRDGRPATGTTSGRTAPPYSARTVITSPYYYSPYLYRSYPYGYYPYGAFGVGFFYYDPFWYDPYWGPYGYWGSGYGYGYGSGYGGGGYYGRAHYAIGGVKLKVKPSDAQVYVDGYYVGRVDDFDGVFQRLDLDEGTHRIEIQATGYQTLSFELKVMAGETITYRGELTPERR